MGSGQSCCGFKSGSSLAGSAGCFFFLFPLFVSSGAASLIARAAERFSRPGAFKSAFFGEINRVAVEMINDSVAVKARCAVSGALFRFSPTLAGAVFRHLGVVLLGALWLLAIAALAAAR